MDFPESCLWILFLTIGWIIVNDANGFLSGLAVSWVIYLLLYNGWISQKSLLANGGVEDISSGKAKSKKRSGFEVKYDEEGKLIQPEKVFLSSLVAFVCWVDMYWCIDVLPLE